MMKCIQCQDEIKCLVSIHTEDDKMPIETSYQWWECKTGGAKYYGILEDDNVNMFDDRLLHKGYVAEESRWQETLAWARQCPDEGNTSCKCKVHQDVPPSGFYGASAWYTYD
jgi:hypothetical protein